MSETLAAKIQVLKPPKNTRLTDANHKMSFVCEGFELAKEQAVQLATEADAEWQRKMSIVATIIGTDIRALKGDTYMDTPSCPAEAAFMLREEIKQVQATIAELRREVQKAKARADSLYKELYPDDLPTMTPRQFTEESGYQELVEAAIGPYDDNMSHREIVAEAQALRAQLEDAQNTAERRGQRLTAMSFEREEWQRQLAAAQAQCAELQRGYDGLASLYREERKARWNHGCANRELPAWEAETEANIASPPSTTTPEQPKPV
jgi:hypothetical protein